jgi:heterodisulfide reductase subunit C
MNIVLSNETLGLAREIEARTGENVLLCYQCRKCTLGCPSAYAMKLRPHELMRAAQLGKREEIYWSGTIWTCLSCETCNTRCPQGINILRVIDGLRELSLTLDCYNPQPSLPVFHRLFMGMIERFGTIFELGLVFLLNLRLLTPFKDIDMAPAMFRKGKLKLFPHPSGGRKELQKVMARIRAMEESR